MSRGAASDRSTILGSCIRRETVRALVATFFLLLLSPTFSRSSSSATLGRPFVESGTPSSTGQAQIDQARSDLAVRDLRRELRDLVDRTRWRGARWSMLAVSLDRGDTIFALDPEQDLAPASNVKLLTTAAALHYLGADFRYPTYVLAHGEVRNGILDGDLILYGTGDPTISARFFEERTSVFESLARQLREDGIWRVAGDVLGDGTFFKGPLRSEGWNPADLNDAFTAPVSALSFNDNVVTLRVEPSTRLGGAPIVHTIPEGVDLPLFNVARTVTTRPSPRLGIGREHPTEPIVVEGQLQRGSSDVWRQLTVGDPVHMASQVFLQTLREIGVAVEGEAGKVSYPGSSPLTGRQVTAPAIKDEPAVRIVAEHLSPPLRDILTVINKESDNLYAELVFQTLGRIVEGNGSFEGGSRAVERFMVEEVGVELGGTWLHDGSGLSHDSRVSAEDFVQLLSYMADSPLWDDYWETFPEAGNRRELGRMYRTAAARNLRAKTGTLKRVSALSGIVTARNGERIAFSLLSNDVPSEFAAKSRIEDQIGVRLASFSRPVPTSSSTASASATATTEPTPRHTVRTGENFSVIAQRYGVSADDLMDANPGISPRRLQAGTVLQIPPQGR